MKRSTFAASATALTLAVAGRASAAITGADAIARLFTSPSVDPSWLAPSLTKVVTPARVHAIVVDLVRALGPYRSVEPNDLRSTVHFERGTVQAEVALDATGAITGLLFSRMQSAAASDRIAALFRTHPIPAAWFDRDFLTHVPLTKVEAVIASIVAHVGPFTGLTPAHDGSYTVALARGKIACQIFLGGSGTIEGLIFTAFS